MFVRRQTHAAFVLGALFCIALPAFAGEPSPSKVIQIKNGPNRSSLAGKELLAVRGRRENFNAHGFDAVTLYLHGPDGIWHVVPYMEPAKKGDTTERPVISASGGADCLLRDFRLLDAKAGRPAQLIVANREFGESYADTTTVHFDYYELTENTESDVGDPLYWFKHVKRVDAPKKYCDVNDAFDKELHLGPTSGERAAGGE